MATCYISVMPNPPRETPVDAFLRRVEASLQDGSFALLRLHPETAQPEEVRLVSLREGPALSFVTHEPRRDLTRNLAVAEGLARLRRSLSRPGSAWLGATTKSWQLVLPAAGGPRLVAQPPVSSEPGRQHDRVRTRRIAGAGEWLHALGLADTMGNPRAGRADKLRQIERYADILAHLVADAGWKEGDAPSVADMGCGKGYLTFAAWHLFRHALRMEATVAGIDAQATVIDSCRAAAERIGAAGLSFQVGTIREAVLPKLDVLLALHACDDATDHALVRGVQAGARLIVVAPCCHKDLRRALGAPDPIAPLLEHGLFKEHFAQWLTDGLRTLALEAAGYRVKVVEFVSPDHTPKNTLIAGIRGTPPARRQAAAAQYAALKAWAGLDALAMDPAPGQA